MTQEVDRDSALYLVRYTKGCRQCQNRDRYCRKWEFHRLVREKGRFKAEGVVKCKYCGNVIKILPQLIKVEVENLYCTQCDGSNFVMDIDRVERANGGFEFSIFLDCRRCSKRFSFLKRIRKAVQAVKTLKLTLKGLEVEFFDMGDQPEHDVQRRTYSWSQYSKLPKEQRLP
ncbi:MAG: hypothetical protein HWN68_20565 [Desulfobacterales bacterium]|nr:hypothetical protein [Desulfobacterales bacterium]